MAQSKPPTREQKPDEIANDPERASANAASTGKFLPIDRGVVPPTLQDQREKLVAKKFLPPSPSTNGADSINPPAIGT